MTESAAGNESQIEPAVADAENNREITSAQTNSINVFISYARDDDTDFHFISNFKRLLKSFISAKFGREISTFVDIYDIEWGETWKDRLDEEIINATVFIPFLTNRYLQSQNCRDEFNRFNSAAQARDVPELLLPILLFDANSVFTSDSDDDIVQTSISRQYEVIQAAVLSGENSPEWKQTMNHIADRFISAHEAAESKLARLTENEVEKGFIQGDLPDDAPGLAEHLVVIEDGLEELTLKANDLTDRVSEVADAAQAAGELPGSGRPRDIQIWAAKAAERFEAPGEKISVAGEEMFQIVSRLDQAVAGIRELAKDEPEIQTQLTNAMASLGDLQVTRRQLLSMLDSMKQAEILSAPLRKRLKPIRTGITKVNDAISTMHRWQKWTNS